MIETLAISGITVEQSKYSSLSGYDPLNDTYGPESNNDLHMIFPDGSEAWLMVENLGLTSLPLEELYVTDYSTLDLGAEFEIDVNNTTYNIDAVKYTPTFYVSMDYMTEMLQTNYPEDLKYRVPIVLRKGWLPWAAPWSTITKSGKAGITGQIPPTPPMKKSL